MNYRPVRLTSVAGKQMEHTIAYLRQVWDKNDWLYEGQRGFRSGYSCESQIITVCPDIADSLDNGDRIDAIIVAFLKPFDLVTHGRLLSKITNSGVDSRVVVWIREFLVVHVQRVRVGQLLQEVRVTSDVPQGSALDPLLFIAYVNDIWRNMASTTRLFAGDCIIYKTFCLDSLYMSTYTCTLAHVHTRMCTRACAHAHVHTHSISLQSSFHPTVCCVIFFRQSL